MQSLKDYTTTQKTASRKQETCLIVCQAINTPQAPDVWNFQEISEFLTMPEMLTNAQVWLEERQGHLTDLFEDMLEDEAERSEFFRFGSSGGF